MGLPSNNVTPANKARCVSPKRNKVMCSSLELASRFSAVAHATCSIEDLDLGMCIICGAKVAASGADWRPRLRGCLMHSSTWQPTSAALQALTQSFHKLNRSMRGFGT